MRRLSLSLALITTSAMSAVAEEPTTLLDEDAELTAIEIVAPSVEVSRGWSGRAHLLRVAGVAPLGIADGPQQQPFGRVAELGYAAFGIDTVLQLAGRVVDIVRIAHDACAAFIAAGPLLSDKAIVGVIGTQRHIPVGIGDTGDVAIRVIGVLRDPAIGVVDKRWRTGQRASGNVSARRRCRQRPGPAANGPGRKTYRIAIRARGRSARRHAGDVRPPGYRRDRQCDPELLARPEHEWFESAKKLADDATASLQPDVDNDQESPPAGDNGSASDDVTPETTGND